MLYYYLILLTNNHSTLNYIVILINLLTYLGTIPGTIEINSDLIIENNKNININASVDLFYLSTELKEQENILISNGIYEIKRTKCINSGFNEIGSGLCTNYSITGDFININGLDNFNNQLENQTIIISTDRILNFQIPNCYNKAASYCSGANLYYPGILTIKKLYN